MRAVLPNTDPRSPSPRIGDLPDPVPGPGEVLVAVEAAGINHADLLQLRGQYPPPPGEPEVPGLECAGRVIGEGSSLWVPGARIMALLGGGGHATRIAVPSGQLMPLPDNLSFAEGGAIPEAALTAWTNLVAEGGLQAGETVLISGASGGMGSFAVQLARELGARVLASGRDRDRLELLRAYGVEEICMAGPHLAHQVREATNGRGVDLVLDFVGGSELPGHVASLRSRGRLVLVGLLAGNKAEVDLGLVLSRRLKIVGSLLRPRSRAEKALLVSDFNAFALPRLKDGRLRPVVDRVVPFEKAADAYRALERGRVFGKVVLSMS
ncbi:MAG TPA: NAD(P)H-quinone oxidoreductase [Thermoanaerobaculia bacterium]|nr:NAD(P)H-quinone oxidoreductase [Thermoanaerobaculia bacterium]